VGKVLAPRRAAGCRVHGGQRRQGAAPRASHCAHVGGAWSHFTFPRVRPPVQSRAPARARGPSAGGAGGRRGSFWRVGRTWTTRTASGRQRCTSLPSKVALTHPPLRKSVSPSPSPSSSLSLSSSPSLSPFRSRSRSLPLSLPLPLPLTLALPLPFSLSLSLSLSHAHTHSPPLFPSPERINDPGYCARRSLARLARPRPRAMRQPALSGACGRGRGARAGGAAAGGRRGPLRTQLAQLHRAVPPPPLPSLPY